MSSTNQSPRLHELTVEQVVLGGAAPEVFHSFKAALLASLKPEGELELTLAENIVVAQWGLRRCRIAETTLATGPAADPLVKWSVHPELRQLDATVRRHERSLERNLRLLRELQTEREFRRLAQVPLTEAPLADASKARRAFIAERAAKQQRLGPTSSVNANQPTAQMTTTGGTGYADSPADAGASTSVPGPQNGSARDDSSVL